MARKVAATETVARTITPTVARRLAITRQRLAGPRPTNDADGVMAVARDLGALQLDPINVVARSHLLVLRSRLGTFDPAILEQVHYQERQLFEYWAHCASIVLTEDYPIHHLMMRSRLTGGTAWEERSRAWMQENAAMVEHVLARLRDEGPLPLNRFENRLVASSWVSTGWNSGRNVARVMDHLWISGAVMVAGRNGIHRLWDVAERCLPDWTPRDELDATEVVHLAAQRSLRALGVARANQIMQHFTRGRYPGLPATLAQLESDGMIVRVAVDGEEARDNRAWAGPWYVHSADLPLLDALADGSAWEPRTTLLSPFDNLICDRKRTKLLFDFDFTIEIYVPQEKRRWGYYVLPILHGDRLIGRIDSAMDRRQARLAVNAVYAEPTAPQSPETGQAVAAAIAELAEFLGAREIAHTDIVPASWRAALR